MKSEWIGVIAFILGIFSIVLSILMGINCEKGWQKIINKKSDEWMIEAKELLKKAINELNGASEKLDGEGWPYAASRISELSMEIDEFLANS
jgi:trehalose utilization protein